MTVSWYQIHVESPVTDYDNALDTRLGVPAVHVVDKHL